MKQLLVHLFAAGCALAVAVFLAPGVFAQAQATPSQAVAGVSEFNSGPVNHLASPFPRPPPPSTQVRVAVLDLSGSLARGNNVALLLTKFRKRDLEAHIGMKIRLANLSGKPKRPARINAVFYRPGFLRAAMLIAKAIPGAQSVYPMPGRDLKKSGVDVQIILGDS